VTEGQREQTIKALAEFFLSMKEIEADELLRSVGAGEVTPGGWGNESDPVRRLAIRRILKEESDEVLSDLASAALPDHFEIRLSQESTSTSAPSVNADEKSSESIFLVHGHARGALYETVRVLERGTGREVIVLREQPNAGRTILEKFEEHAAGAAFAVVLITADDEGGIRASGEMRPRGRQNVIFELGFFFGTLGRQRVAVLLEEGVEKPSDVAGLVYIIIDHGGAWKYLLARELEAAGISVDRSRIP
jgi:predicted nucleotide-binding protein